MLGILNAVFDKDYIINILCMCLTLSTPSRFSAEKKKKVF